MRNNPTTIEHNSKAVWNFSRSPTAISGEKKKNARRREEVPAGVFLYSAKFAEICNLKDGRRRPPERVFLLGGLACVMRDVRACNTQVRQFTVRQHGQFVVCLTEAFPVVVFANYCIEHFIGLSLSHGLRTRIGVWPVHLLQLQDREFVQCKVEGKSRGRYAFIALRQKVNDFSSHEPTIAQCKYVGVLRACERVSAESSI
jgi:hypothetical protein